MNWRLDGQCGTEGNHRVFESRRVREVFGTHQHTATNGVFRRLHTPYLAFAPESVTGTNRDT